MTDSEQKSGGLPTAGVYAELVYYREGEEVNRISGTWLKESKLRSNAHYDDIQNLDELVRRKDVKTLIQDKIEEENDFEEVKMANNPVKAKLKDLLEEIR